MSKVITAIYLLTAALWILLTFNTGHSDHPAGLYFQIILFLIPFLGALFGFRNGKLWGGMKSAVGKAVIFLALGTFTWSLGMLAWNYYIFLAQVEVPYPSLADAAFILSWPLWGLGIIYLSRATGVKFALRQTKGKALLVLVPLVAMAISYYFLVEVARGGVMDMEGSSGWKIFFDLFYPIGTAVLLAMSLTFFTLSREFLGGRYKTPIAILIFAFIVNCVSDFTFSLTTTNETYFNGHFVDFLFLTAMFLLSLSLAKMSPPADNIKR